MTENQPPTREALEKPQADQLSAVAGDSDLSAAAAGAVPGDQSAEADETAADHQTPTEQAEAAAGGGSADEDYLEPGQTVVPMGEEVVADDETMRRALEAILMVADEPQPVLTLARAVGRPTGDVAAALAELAEEYTAQGRGFELREVGGGWRYYTRADAAAYVERFVLDGQQARLTQAALETLAVVAYKQPVSRARVSAIRGVNVDGVMRTLVARGLVEEAGADTESQATLYRTSSYFLERMGMQSLDDLPELAPYLPEMDDIEDELAAQNTPDPATAEPVPADPDPVPADPDPVPADPDPVPAEPDLVPADAGPVDGESPDEPDTGIDGDIQTDEPVDLDLTHDEFTPGPSQEIQPEAAADQPSAVGPAEEPAAPAVVAGGPAEPAPSWETAEGGRASQQQPADGEQVDAAGDQLPVEGEQGQAGGEQVPLDGEQVEAEREQEAGEGKADAGGDQGERVGRGREDE